MSNIIFDAGTPIPQTLTHPDLTPELQARMQGLVDDLRAAGFSVALLAVPASGLALTVVNGEGRLLLPVLSGAFDAVRKQSCPCPTCAAERARTRGDA